MKNFASNASEVTAKHVLHKIKKRGKREAEQLVKEFNVVVSDPSPENLSVYATKLIKPGSVHPMKLKPEHVLALQQMVAMISHMVTQTPAWQANALQDLTWAMIREPEGFERKRNAVWLLAERSKLSRVQIPGFSSSTGLLVDQADVLKADPKNMGGFR